MAGRRPVPANMINNDTLHISNEELEERIDAEPIYNSQVFAVPEELTPEEIKKWNELVILIRSVENSPNSDADKDTMILYCQAWVRYIALNNIVKSKPDDREAYKQMMDNAKLLAKLKSDLCLDIVSRAKIGKARNDFKKKKSDPIGDIRNRQGK